MSEKLEEKKLNLDNFQDKENVGLIWPIIVGNVESAFTANTYEGKPYHFVKIDLDGDEKVVLMIYGKLMEKYPIKTFIAEKDHVMEIKIFNSQVNFYKKNKTNNLTLRTAEKGEEEITFYQYSKMDLDESLIEPTKEQEIETKKKEFKEMKEENKKNALAKYGNKKKEEEEEEKHNKLTMVNVFDFFPQLKDKFTLLQVAVAIEQCNRLGLDPLAKEINLIPRQDKISTEIPYLTYIRIGKSHPNFSHYKAGIVLQKGEEELIVEGTRDKGLPVIGGWCRIYLKDGNETFFDIDFDKYKPIAKWSLWDKMPGVMVRKSVISFGFRETFPDFFIGTLGQEEMEQAE